MNYNIFDYNLYDYYNYCDNAKSHVFSLGTVKSYNGDRGYIRDETASLNTIIGPITYIQLRDIKSSGLIRKFHDDCWKIVWTGDNGKRNYEELLRRRAVRFNAPNNFVNPKTEIDQVIFHDPATIVYWSDGVKTVVKCSENDIFDKEKGLAMAILKRTYGDEYYKDIKKLMKIAETFDKLEEPETNSSSSIQNAVNEVCKNFDDFFTALKNYTDKRDN